MKIPLSAAHTLAAFLTVIMGLRVEEAKAGLTLTINEATPNRISLTISGVFDANAAGDQQQWLAIKGDWSDNKGVNVDWIADSVGWGTLSSRPGVTIVEDSIAFSGFSIEESDIAASQQTWGDAIYFEVNGAITAGTQVSGTITLAGSGLFNFGSIESLQLVSGFDNSRWDWERLEATAVVPEPTTAVLFGFGILGLFFRRIRNVRHPEQGRSSELPPR